MSGVVSIEVRPSSSTSYNLSPSPTVFSKTIDTVTISIVPNFYAQHHQYCVKLLCSTVPKFFVNYQVAPGYIVVRALHNKEVVPTLSGLDKIGIQLAKEIPCSYHPEWLSKTRYTKELKALRKTDRVNELREVYQFKPSQQMNADNFLIIDDILTTGTTAFSIAKAIVNSFPQSNVSTFTLAKVDYDTQLNERLSFHNNSYHWERRTGWQVNEEELKYNQLQGLKHKILADRF